MDKDWNHISAEAEREMKFMLLLKKVYDKDMKLIMACMYDPVMSGEKPKPEFYRE